MQQRKSGTVETTNRTPERLSQQKKKIDPDFFWFDKEFHKNKFKTSEKKIKFKDSK